MAIPEIDLLSPEVLADPFTTFNRLREESAVCRATGLADGAYVLTRYEHVSGAAKSNAPRGPWSARFGQVPTHEPKGGLFSDPPDHGVYRRMLQPMHQRTTVEGMAPLVASIADTLLDEMADDDVMDVYSQFAVPLPIRVIGQMLGVPDQDFEQMKLWSDALVQSINSGDPATNAQVREDIHNYFSAIIDEREAILDAAADPDPSAAFGTVLPADAISRLVIANRTTRPMSRQLMTGMLRQQLKGGNETTTSLLTNVIWRLLQMPDLYRRVCADLSLVDVVIEESLRFDPPVLGLFRIALEDVEIDGVTIPGGSRALLLWASANRDPRVWEDPDRFRIDRDLTQLRRQTLAFGTGIHTCQGAPLARLEGRIGLEKLLHRLPGLRAAGPDTRVSTGILWGRSSIPVSWDHQAVLTNS